MQNVCYIVSYWFFLHRHSLNWIWILVMEDRIWGRGMYNICLTNYKIIRWIKLLSLHFSETFHDTFVQTITQLDLGYNHIGDKGARYIADVLRKNKVTSILYFLICSYIYFDNFTQTLTFLDLTLRRITDTEATYLADGLRENSVILFLSFFHSTFHFVIQTLTTLCLRHNDIGDMGAKHLADTARTNTVIFFFS